MVNSELAIAAVSMSDDVRRDSVNDYPYSVNCRLTLERAEAQC